MTKLDIVEVLHRKSGLPKKNAMQIVETFFEIIREQLERGEEVKLAGFGNFTTRQKSSRVGRNPRTMEEVTISQREVISFHPSHILRTRIDPHHQGTTAEQQSAS
ncbi:MAG: integration host factor subunit alpha [Magnetococcales bacterium]|nr:integration host factor subunit alpha [Magnetococcales bacterium]